jgi:hypothetical protein
MMAELIEVQDDQGSIDSLNQSIEGTTTDNSVTLDEIVKMHQEAEKLIGRQAQEVGEVRKLADELIKQQLNTNKQDTQPRVEDNDIDYFADPDKAVNHAVENNPVVKQLREQSEIAAKQQVLAALQQKYPDYLSIVQTEDFANWIKSSKVRTNLLIEYTAIKGMKAQNAQKADQALVDDAKTTRSQTLKSAAVQKGGTGEVGKPVYKRVDLIRLRMTDPNRYNDMQDEIMQAYNEGRVR